MLWTKKRTEQLTAAQRATLQAVCEKWDRVGLSTAPADREEAERGVVELYQAVGLKAPRKFIWFKSFKGWGKDEYPGATPDFEDPLRGLVNVVWEGGNGIRRFFTAPAVHSVEAVIAESVYSQWSMDEIHTYRGLEHHRNFSRPISYGQDDTAIMAFAEFFAKASDVELHKGFSSLVRIISSCGYCVPGEDPELVLLYDRPVAIHLDDRRRPHCLDGPAIRYRDGFKVYAIHGVPVPMEYIKTPAEQIDLRKVLREENAEVRTAVISKIGLTRLLASVERKERYIERVCPHCGGQIPKRDTKRKKEHGAVVVSKANGNSLIEFTFGRRNRRSGADSSGPEKFRALHLTWQDKTGSKETILPVPRTKQQFGRDRPDDIDDCEQVRRWTLSWPKDVEILTET